MMTNYCEICFHQMWNWEFQNPKDREYGILEQKKLDM